jgi:hypothetical protein
MLADISEKYQNDFEIVSCLIGGISSSLYKKFQ